MVQLEIDADEGRPAAAWVQRIATTGENKEPFICVILAGSHYCFLARSSTTVMSGPWPLATLTTCSPEYIDFVSV
jgi:hypothetical protein